MTDRGSSPPGRMLIAGVGNIFLGDDAFGPEVARRLAAENLPGWPPRWVVSTRMVLSNPSARS